MSAIPTDPEAARLLFRVVDAVVSKSGHLGPATQLFARPYAVSTRDGEIVWAFHTSNDVERGCVTIAETWAGLPSHTVDLYVYGTQRAFAGSWKVDVDDGPSYLEGVVNAFLGHVIVEISRDPTGDAPKTFVIGPGPGLEREL